MENQMKSFRRNDERLPEEKFVSSGSRSSLHLDAVGGSFSSGHLTVIDSNVDKAARASDQDGLKRERAVRRLVRAIIETGGGNNKSVNGMLDTHYKRGEVWWQDRRVAMLDNEQVQFTKHGGKFRGTFAELFMDS